MSTPTKKQIKTQSLQLSRSGILNTYSKLGPASNQPKKSREERELNQSMSCGFTHVCLATFGNSILSLKRTPKLEINQVWPETLLLWRGK